MRKKFSKESKPMNFWNDKENCFKMAEGCRTIRELQLKSCGCYQGLKRNGWLYEAFPQKGVPMNYWNDKGHCAKEAAKYTRKIDFIKANKSCYNAIMRNGWTDLFDGYGKGREYDSMSKKVHCVYAYEIAEEHACYVGRTKEFHKRDLDHRRSKKHHDGSETFDTLYLFCEEHGVGIPKPKILAEGLDAEESLIEEDAWLNRYKDDGWFVINKAKTGKTSGSLGCMKIWTYDKCKDFVKDFKYKGDVRKASYTCYETCKQNGWLEEFGLIDYDIKPHGFWNDKDNVIAESKKHSNRKSFINKAYGAYKSARDKGWLKDLDLWKE